jgi:hypothetical protein
MVNFSRKKSLSFAREEKFINKDLQPFFGAGRCMHM